MLLKLGLRRERRGIMGTKKKQLFSVSIRKFYLIFTHVYIHKYDSTKAQAHALA